MGETRSIHFLGRNEIRETYGIQRVWCRIALKMSEVKCVGVKWIDLTKCLFCYRTLNIIMKACILLTCTLQN